MAYDDGGINENSWLPVRRPVFRLTLTNGQTETFESTFIVNTAGKTLAVNQASIKLQRVRD